MLWPQAAEIGGFIRVTGHCTGERNIIRGAFVIDVVGLKNRARKFLQQVILFIGSAIGTDDADRCAALSVANFFQPGCCVTECVFPGSGLKLALRITDERLAETFGAVNEVESKAALGAEEVAVNAAFVTVVGPNNFRAVVGLADAESDFAAVAAVRANGGDVIHLPRTRLVAIAAAR